jgi:hypothetical protein
MKRAWALSHPWDWWRTDSSRRLVMGSLRRAGVTGPEREEPAGSLPLRLVSPPPPSGFVGLGLLVPFPAGSPDEAGDDLPSLPSPDQPPV